MCLLSSHIRQPFHSPLLLCEARMLVWCSKIHPWKCEYSCLLLELMEVCYVAECVVSRWMFAPCEDSKERIISSFDVHVVPTRYNSQVVELSPIVVLTTVLCPSALASCLFNCCRVSGAINIILQTSRLLVYKWLTWICRIFTYWYFIISWKLEPCAYPIT